MTEISIGICCYNEEKNIANLLENITSFQNLSQNSEILIVCSGCTDSTPQIVQKYLAQDSRIELIIENERKGKASALNEILRRYRGRYLFLIPGDVLPAKYSLPLLQTFLTSSRDIGVVCGKVVPINRHNGFAGYLSHLVWRMHNRTLLFLDKRDINIHVTGELMAIKRIIKRIPIDIINEDAYIGLIATSQGLRTRYCEEAIVYIKAPENILDFIKQRRRIIYGHHRVRALTGRIPRTLTSMIPFDFNKPIRIIADEIREYPKETFKFICAIGLEIISNILAIIDSLLKKDHVLWSRVDSTKAKVAVIEKRSA